MTPFAKLSETVSCFIGSPLGVGLNVGSIAVGLVVGCVLQWSAGYSLAFNLALSIEAILIALLIQASQNRDTAAILRMLREQVRVDPRIPDAVAEE